MPNNGAEAIVHPSYQNPQRPSLVHRSIISWGSQVRLSPLDKQHTELALIAALISLSYDLSFSSCHANILIL